MHRGYIIIARKMFDSEIMSKPPMYLKLWVWMLNEANFNTREKLSRGQFVATISDMQKAMSYKVGYRKITPSKDEIRSAYEAFTKATMITTTKTTRGMIITICNYSTYQNFKNYEAHSETLNETPTKPTVTPHDTEGIKGKELKTLHPLAEMWNSITTSQSKVISCNEGRLRKINKRLKEQPMEFWQDIFTKINSTPFLRGENNNGWKADFDWIIENDTNYSKVAEGKYGSVTPIKSLQDRLVEACPAMAGCR